MRPWLPSALALLGLGLLPAVGAQGSSGSMASLPDCATKCLESAMTDSVCKPDDQKCICGDQTLQAGVTTCVQGSCTIKESLTTKNATEQSCGVTPRDKNHHINVITTAVGSLTGSIVIFRLAFKLITRLGWSLDDWFILATGLTAASSTALTCLGAGKNGLGRDIWTLPFDMVVDFGYYFYIMAFLYFLEVTLLKMSILFFYMRIFPERNVRRVLWATQALNAAFGAAYVFAAIGQCRPVSYNWTRWDGEHEGKCIDIPALTWSNAIVSIVFDVWMIAVPLSQLKKLKLHWKRKVGVGLMFGVGTFVTVLSILRLRSIVDFTKSPNNATWYNTNVTMWSVIEIGVGTVCACMPTIRMALVRCFSVFRETTVGYSKYAKKSYQRSYFRSSHFPPHSRSTRGDFSGGAGTMDCDGPERPGGVMMKKSFAVEYGDGHEDDSTLVPMREFVISGGSSTKSGRSSRSV